MNTLSLQPVRRMWMGEGMALEGADYREGVNGNRGESASAIELIYINQEEKRHVSE